MTLRRLRIWGTTVVLPVVVALGFSSIDPAVALGAEASFLPRIIRVSAGSDPVQNGALLQSAIDAARPGDFVELPYWATFSGNFSLPYKDGTRWIVIYSSAFWRLPLDKRVSTADAGLMPKIKTPNRGPAIRTDPRAHHYALAGIEITTVHSPTADQDIANLVKLETPEEAPQTRENLPSDIILYRCYIHGTPTGEVRRGVALNGARMAVVGSHLSDFHQTGEDSQAIMGWKGPGPFTIVGNYLEAAGENVMFGGGTPSIPNLVPSDIEIRGNYFVKPLSWRVGDPAYAGTPWRVKNLLEFKNAQRVVVDGNVFENNWTQADQGGFAIVLTPRGIGGTVPWAVVAHITFTNNVIRRSTAGMLLLGWDDSGASQQLQRVRIANNLFVDVGAFPDTVFNGIFTGMLFHFNSPAGTGWADVVIDHNTAVHCVDPAALHCGPLSVNVIDGSAVYAGFVFTNNIALHGRSGFNGNANTILSAYFPGYVFARNALVGGVVSDYPSDNFFPASLADVRFVDLVGGDFRLADTSPLHDAGTDGEDIGADIDALAATLSLWGLSISP